MTHSQDLAVLGSVCTTVGVLGSKAVDYVLALKKSNADLTISAATTSTAAAAHELQAWEQWRADNAQLRTDMADLRTSSASEIADLRGDVDKLRGEVRAMEKKLEAAEAKVIHLREQLDASQADGVTKAERIAELESELADAIADRDKYRDAMNSLTVFYDAKVSGREADDGMLGVIEEKLRAAGCLSEPVSKGRKTE